jgi:hypothetical protein
MRFKTMDNDKNYLSEYLLFAFHIAQACSTKIRRGKQSLVRCETRALIVGKACKVYQKITPHRLIYTFRKLMQYSIYISKNFRHVQILLWRPSQTNNINYLIKKFCFVNSAHHIFNNFMQVVASKLLYCVTTTNNRSSVVRITQRIIVPTLLCFETLFVYSRSESLHVFCSVFSFLAVFRRVRLVSACK